MQDPAAFFSNHMDDLVPIIAIVSGCVIALVWIVLATISETMKQSNRERSRREIAAYIAEGSMTPDQGERLLKAKPDPDEEI